MDSEAFVAYGHAMGHKRSNTTNTQMQPANGTTKAKNRVRSRSDTILSLTKAYNEEDNNPLSRTISNVDRLSIYEGSCVPLKTIKQRRDYGFKSLLSKTSNVTSLDGKYRARQISDISDMGFVCKDEHMKRPVLVRRISAPSRTTSMDTLNQELSDTGATNLSDTGVTKTTEADLTDLAETEIYVAKEERHVMKYFTSTSNKQVDFQMDVSLHDAITRDDADEVCNLIQQNPDMDIKKPDSVGITALHRASIEGAYRCLNLLLSQNVVVNVKDVEGWTPLHDAVYHGHIRCAAALITAGANVEAETNEFTKPIEMAEDNDMLLLVGRAMAAPGLYFDPDRETLV